MELLSPPHPAAPRLEARTVSRPAVPRVPADAGDDWMRALARHFAEARGRRRQQPLMIVFDIDGTLLDTRVLHRRLLQAFDRAHGTRHFVDLAPEDVSGDEEALLQDLQQRGLDGAARERVRSWCRRHRWSPAAGAGAHRPHRGAFDVVRWFQLQPGVAVGLNTARPERLRAETLDLLNALGREHRVEFRDDLLFMNPDGFEHDVRGAKLAGLRYFAQRGYHVFAVVDDHDDNIEAMADADGTGEILFLRAALLHPGTGGGGTAATLPRTVRGSDYDLTRLAAGAALPRRTQLAVHDVNDEAALARFLGEGVAFAELDVRRDALDRIVLQPAGPEAPASRAEPLALERALRVLETAGKGAKLNLNVDAAVLPRVLAIVRRSRLPDERLWFTARPDVLGEAALRQVAAAHSGAVLDCPVDFVLPLLGALEPEARAILARLRGWGATRFSIRHGPGGRAALARLLELTPDVNVTDVRDLASYLQVALQLPRSITKR